LEFRDISRVSEAITAKEIKIVPYCQRRNYSPLNVLFSDVYIALTSQGVPQLGGVKQRWDDKNKSSYTHGCRALALARLSCYLPINSHKTDCTRGGRSLCPERQSARMSKITSEGLTRSRDRMLYNYSCTHMATVGVKGLKVSWMWMSAPSAQ